MDLENDTVTCTNAVVGGENKIRTEDAVESEISRRIRAEFRAIDLKKTAADTRKENECKKFRKKRHGDGIGGGGGGGGGRERKVEGDGFKAKNAVITVKRRSSTHIIILKEIRVE